VDGDYKNPPPKGKYDAIYARSKKLMKRAPIKIATDLRQFVANMFAEKLRTDQIEVLIISADAKHVHILARFPDHNPRYWIGWAKKYVTQTVKAHSPAVGLNLASGDGLWAKRSHPEPIESRPPTPHLRVHPRPRQRGGKIWRFDKPSSPEKAHG
jgi:REP element-mobilizing transposase RayT